MVTKKSINVFTIMVGILMFFISQGNAEEFKLMES